MVIVMREQTFRTAFAIASLLSVMVLVETSAAQGVSNAVPSGAVLTAPAAMPGEGMDAAVPGRGGRFGRGGAGLRAAPLQRPNPLPPFYDPKLSLNKRVDDLISRLTLEEKVSLMGMDSASIPRLGIASYRWWNEALHGVANGTATVFPNPTGLAAAWDVNLQHEMARAIGQEGRARHAAQGSGLDFWAPNLNLLRDPRWGRAQETYGEDPYLSGRLAVAFVTGMQGDDPFYFQAISTPKHYAVHSGPEPERHRMNMVISDQDLYTTYLPQFEAAVREGHCFSIMSAYSALNGIPDSGNKRLLTDILRDQWGFKGYVVSDVDAVADIYRAQAQFYTSSGVTASALAILAGNDLCSGSTYYGGDGGSQGGAVQPGPSSVARAISRGLLTEKDVDVSLRRIIEARIRMGEFDPPGYEGNPFNKITADMIDTETNNALARRVADESMVLLKNANHTLPLRTGIGTVAVLGPNANAPQMQNGNYSGRPSARHQVSIIDGIRQAVGADHVITTTNLRVPISGNLALAEPVKADCLFTDVSKTKHGLMVTMAASEAGLGQPTRTEVSETGTIQKPDAAGGVAYDPALAARMTGVLVPPMTGEYQLGARGRDAFRISIDGKVVLDEMQGGPQRIASACVSLEKEKVYNVLVEFSHTPKSGERETGQVLSIGKPEGPVTAPPKVGTSERSPAFVYNPGGGGRGGRGGRGGQFFGATTEYPGMTATASADANSNPLFQLAWTKPIEDGMPANTAGQSLFAEAVDLARKADAVVLVVGLDGSQEGEEFDRSTIELPVVQDGLIRAVTRAAGNKPVVVVNCSGSMVALNWADENVPAIIQAWYPGQRGDAVADVLFGTYNPAGRLPMTFYRSNAGLPALIDYSMAARTYRYFTKPVLYPFGHGLSYSTFEYSKLSTPGRASTGKDVKVSVNVKNTSRLDGEEVVQCYLNRDVPAMDPGKVSETSKMTDEQATLAATPRKALVGFARVPLKAGQSKKVTFTITTQQLSLVVGKDGKREVRPGNLQIQVGGRSAMDAGTLTQSLALAGPATAPEYRFVAPVVQ
jgi:beta-glucosidase